MYLENQNALLCEIQKIIKLKKDGKPVTFNTLCGDHLFSNLTIEENLLHQSYIKSLSDIQKLVEPAYEKELLQVVLINFSKFYPKSVPAEVITVISFYSFILKDTDYGIYLPPPVISEDENQVAQMLIKFMEKNRKKVFLNVKNNKLEIIKSPERSKASEIKKAA